MPDHPDALLDLSTAAARLDRVARELTRLSAEVRRAGEVGWRSPAADLFRERVARRSARLLALADDAGWLSRSLPELEAAARARAELAADLVPRLWSGLR